MLNVGAGDLASVLALLPALQRPTISPLSDDEWVAVNTIIEERTVRDLIPRLKAARGAGHRRVSAQQDRPLSDQVHAELPHRRAIRILRSDTDGAAVAALVGRSSARECRGRASGGGDIVSRVRRGGDRALLAFAKKFDGLDGAIEVSRAEMRAAARGRFRAAVKRAIRLAAAEHPRRRPEAGSPFVVGQPGRRAAHRPSASRRSTASAVTCPAAAILCRRRS